ncbi:MAG: D-Ala-D-Ala carboxypeptidase family metallohydrolase [Gemmatimonadaceae bacterium]
MRSTHHARRRKVGRAIALCLVVAGAGVALRRPAAVAFAAGTVGDGVASALAAPRGAFTEVGARSSAELDRLFPEVDSLRGRSGKLRALLVPRSDQRVGALQRLFGDSLLGTPGVHDVRDSAGTPHFSLITMRDFAEKLGGRIGTYRIGFWPGEAGRTPSLAYGNPEGFIEVTPENMDTRVSEHFQLRDFLTHDQQDVWPKYLVLRAPLVDKLELVIAQLEARGTPVEHMSVMSGFRTPQYNATGGETGGRAALSRHMYGDAADVFVDNDGDGRMDDLNRDRRIDYRDAQVILDAVEQVERAHADLVGGVGVYRATRSHGPFAHVDVRGRRARWGLL